MAKKELTRFHGLLSVENIKHIRDMAKLYEIHPSEYLDRLLDQDRKSAEAGGLSLTSRPTMEVRV